MSLSSWYNSQYSTWNRTRRLQQSQYLARTNTNTSRAATAMAQANGPVVINMGNVPEPKDKEKKSQDSLFGPNIGIVNAGPPWTTVNEKKVLTDELTQDIVQSWVQKSMQANQPTTTLQALVNLKRPTLRLSPLSSDEEHHHQHGLEFEYDCDAPKCGIYVHVLLPSDHPDAGPSTSASHGLSKLLVFESVVDGGFGRVLKLDEGATLELGRFENIPPTTKKPLDSSSNSSTTNIHATADNTDATQAATDGTSHDAAGNHRRRRFTHFTFRKRPHSGAVTGPALAVVDAQPETGAKTDLEDPDKDGVRVTIRLAALDEHGTELASPNEQVTYLHVIRFGNKPDTAEHPEGEAEDTRPWVVKVVKREATIGPHTFHLHEIYGLSASSVSAPAPTAPLPGGDHTYPPTTPATAGATAVPLLQNAPAAGTTEESEPSSECLVCLSSPREVVLLPCRHLVACKDCAINMIEFGAGGAISQGQDNPAEAGGATPATGAGETTTTAAAAEEGAGETATVAAAPAAAPATPTTTTNPRRKRKAKGWFCPVCRQPYTSLLRITTSQPPPAPAEESTKVEQSGNTTAEGNNTTTATGGGGGGDPLSGNETTTTTPAPSSRLGLFAISRPSFLRGRSSAQSDLERQ